MFEYMEVALRADVDASVWALIQHVSWYHWERKVSEACIGTVCFQVTLVKDPCLIIRC